MNLIESFGQILRSQETNYKEFYSKREAVVSQSDDTCAVFNEKYDLQLDSLPRQSQEHKAKVGATFNLMVAGQSGLGKTTFINTLLSTGLLPNIWKNLENNQTHFAFEKTTRITRKTLHLVEDNFHLDFTVIDTPGFCDAIDNQFSYIPIIEYIEQQLRLYMFQDEQPERKSLVDNRVHTCLYFLNTSSRGLGSFDIEALKHISKRVNIIPVLSKADTLTSIELRELKELVKNILEIQDIKVCELIEDEEVKSTILNTIPYSLINSESLVSKEDGSSVRGRKYDWGIAEVENLDHCDFMKLREVLMSKHMIDLIKTSEAYYEKYRNKLISTRINKAKEILQESEIPADYNFDKPDQNGLSNYQVLSKFSKSFIDDLAVEWNPIFINRKLSQRRMFNEIVSMEEKKFKDWKKALFAKQTLFNNEIDQYHQIIKSLTEEIQQLKQSSSVNSGLG